MPEITWTNCADAMPPDDASEIIVTHILFPNELSISHGDIIEDYIIFNGSYDQYKWTPYTSEKWKELNK